MLGQARRDSRRDPAGSSAKVVWSVSVDELRERFVGDGSTVDPESVDRHRAPALLRVVRIGAHDERAAGNPHHVGRGASRGGDCGIAPGSCVTGAGADVIVST